LIPAFLESLHSISVRSSLSTFGDQLPEANLTQRLVIFVETESLPQVWKKVFVVTEMDESDEQHGKERADPCQQHVLLCVPNISLASQKGETRLGIYLCGHDPLDNFVNGGQRKGHVQGQVVTPETSDLGNTQEGLAHGICEEEAEGEMRQSVVHIALRSEPMLKGVAEGHQ
jgi:hypothetical protein